MNKYYLVKYSNTDFMFMQFCLNGKARFTTKKHSAEKFKAEKAVLRAQRLNKLGYKVFLRNIDEET